MKTFTIEDIRSWQPCYDPIKYLPEEWTGTALDILKHEYIPPQDKLWVVCREDLIHAKILRLFAVWCCRQIQHLLTDERSIHAVNIAEKFANGEVGSQELAAARDAASDAARAAAWAASDAAWAATWAASDAARAAAWAASDAAWDAARAASDAASDAARAAAWAASDATWAATWAASDAARAAAWAAQIAQLIKMLEDKDSEWVEVDFSDNIFGRVLSNRSGVKKIKTDNGDILFVVADENGNTAHGKTIKEARADLIYKNIAKFEGEIPKSATGVEWVGIYRSVTGACAAGVKMFVESKKIDLTKSYKAKAVATLVKGQYGSDKFSEKILGKKEGE